MCIKKTIIFCHVTFYSRRTHDECFKNLKNKPALRGLSTTEHVRSPLDWIFRRASSDSLSNGTEHSLHWSSFGRSLSLSANEVSSGRLSRWSDPLLGWGLLMGRDSFSQLILAVLGHYPVNSNVWNLGGVVCQKVGEHCNIRRSLYIFHDFIWWCRTTTCAYC